MARDLSTPVARRASAEKAINTSPSLRLALAFVALHLGAFLLLLLSAWLWWPLALLAALPAISLGVVVRDVVATLRVETAVLWLRRAQHPELFALFDEATSAMGMPALQEVELLPQANAFATTHDGRGVVALGMPLVALFFGGSSSACWPTSWVTCMERTP